jgi:hypothetical protein
MPGCEGVAKGFAKGLSKGLTCKSKGSKGFVRGYAYKQHSSRPYGFATHKGSRPSQNPFEPFEALVNPYAHPFANPFATPSHRPAGAR